MDLGLRAPDYYLGVIAENVGQTMEKVISKSYDLMVKVKPDAVIVLDKATSCLSVTSAKCLKIPVFHMKAGNRCKDGNLPEETNRRIVDVISDVNMCYSEFAWKYLADTGLPKESSFYLSVGHPIAAVCICTSTERSEALEAGDFILAGITAQELLNATDMAIEMKQKDVLGKPCPDYVDETVSMKVVRIVQGVCKRGQ